MIKNRIDMKEESVLSAIKRLPKEISEVTKTHPNNRFDIVDEAYIAAIILRLDKLGTPMKDSELLKLAQETIGVGGPSLTNKWLRGFRERWNIWLHSSRSSAMQAERINTLRLKDVEGFLASWHKMERKILSNGSNLVIAETKIVLPEGWSDSRKHPFKVVYAATAKGYVTTALWGAIMKEFHLVCLQKFDLRGCVLLVDNLAAHVNPENVAECAKNNIWMWMIPPHTSHAIQPNNNGVNAVAKSMAHKKRDQEIRASVIRGITPSSVVSTILLDVIAKSVTKTVIKASWKRTGIWPWNPELITELCELKHHRLAKI
jgi:hypothetical protein